MPPAQPSAYLIAHTARGTWEGRVGRERRTACPVQGCAARRTERVAGALAGSRRRAWTHDGARRDPVGDEGPHHVRRPLVCARTRPTPSRGSLHRFGTSFRQPTAMLCFTSTQGVQSGGERGHEAGSGGAGGHLLGNTPPGRRRRRADRERRQLTQIHGEHPALQLPGPQRAPLGPADMASPLPCRSAGTAASPSSRGTGWVRACLPASAWTLPRSPCPPSSASSSPSPSTSAGCVHMGPWWERPPCVRLGLTQRRARVAVSPAIAVWFRRLCVTTLLTGAAALSQSHRPLPLLSRTASCSGRRSRPTAAPSRTA